MLADSGTPVVTFDTGGCSECINEQNGIVVPKGDVDALVKAVKQVCNTERYDVNYEKTKARSSTQQEYFILYKELYERSVKKAALYKADRRINNDME